MATLDSRGFIPDTLPTLQNNKILELQTIYGSDIDTSSNSIGGQIVNIVSQSILDFQQNLQNITTNFDPISAQGIAQDRLYVLNNLFRQGATYTYQNVQITIDRGISLQGLDSLANDINGIGFTVEDNNGQQFILLDSQNPVTPGTYTYTFRSKSLGAITTTANTITNPVTIVIGVTAINNATSQTTIGINEELDAVFRARQQLSTANNAKSSEDSIYSNIIALSGVISAKVYQNDTDTTDSNGIPGHTMYAIVEGGSDTNIANEIFIQKTMGCGMLGSTVISVLNAQGRAKDIKFDRPQGKILYITLDIKATKVGQSFNQTAIKNYAVANLIYNIGDIAETSKITSIFVAAINSAGDGGVPLDVQISKDNITFTNLFINVDLLKEKWIVSANNITITVI